MLRLSVVCICMWFSKQISREAEVTYYMHARGRGVEHDAYGVDIDIDG